jgi:WD40 repeat protein
MTVEPGRDYNRRYDAIVLLDVATQENHVTLTLRAVLKGHTNHVHAAAFSPDGRLLASAGPDKADKVGEIKLWDARTGQELVSLPDTAPVHCVAFSPDGKLLASANKDGTLKLWATEVLLSARKKPE